MYNPKQSGQSPAHLIQNLIRHATDGTKATRRSVKRTYLIDENRAAHCKAIWQDDLGWPRLLI